MNVYWFDVQVSGPVTLDDVETLGDVLIGREMASATQRFRGVGERSGRVMFSREADGRDPGGLCLRSGMSRPQVWR